MRSCSALYIDAGYLLASAATRVCGTSLRASVNVDHEKLVARLIEQVEKDSGLPLMRANWYDSGNGSGGQPDSTQTQLGLMPHVKLRLGRRSYSGEQKGVDLRLGLDLVTQARNRAIDIAYLLSGDDDLTEAVGEAQDHGVQVIVFAVPTAQDTPHAVARHLQMEADGLTLIDGRIIDETVTRLPRSAEAQLLSGDSGAATAMRAIATAVGAHAGEPGSADSEHEGEPHTPGREGGQSDTAAVAGEPTRAVADHAAAADKHEGESPLHGTARPVLPTPAVLSRLRAGGAGGTNGSGEAHPGSTRPAARGHGGAADAALVYSTTHAHNGVIVTDRYSGRHADSPGDDLPLQDADAASIDAVCRSVLQAWVESASDQAREGLHRDRPAIPAEVDRALLRDLSMRINTYEIVEQDRHALRAHFWRVVDEESVAPSARS